MYFASWKIAWTREEVRGVDLFSSSLDLWGTCAKNLSFHLTQTMNRGKIICGRFQMFAERRSIISFVSIVSIVSIVGEECISFQFWRHTSWNKSNMSFAKSPTRFLVKDPSKLSHDRRVELEIIAERWHYQPFAATCSAYLWLSSVQDIAVTRHA